MRPEYPARRPPGATRSENRPITAQSPTVEWIDDTHRFWYRKTVEGGDEFVLVDAETLEKRPAFDHARLASAVSAAVEDGDYTAVTLPFRSFDFVDDGGAIVFDFRGDRWRCGLDVYDCRPVDDDGSGGGGDDDDREVCVSPDGTREAFIQNYNVAVREVGSDEFTVLSTDGSEGDYYSISSLAWSPDSKKLAAYRVRPGYGRVVHYIDSAPEDQLQPRHFTRRYLKPGDLLDRDRPVLFDLASGSQDHDRGRAEEGVSDGGWAATAGASIGTTAGIGKAAHDISSTTVVSAMA